jgi:ribosomal protein S18 acetylase RimI-like enzyme
MRHQVDIVEASAMDDEIVSAMQRLIPQLSSSTTPPDAKALKEITASQCTKLLLARDPNNSGQIVGTLTLVTFRIPTGVRAWIEDVVVDECARGRGVGEALSREALRMAAAKGARTVELTSRSSRQAANRLYRRLGFQLRETNVYRFSENMTAG